MWQLTLYLGKRDYVDDVDKVDRVGTFLLQSVFSVFVFACGHYEDNNCACNPAPLQTAS